MQAPVVPIHPFPARMAPEIALAAMARLPPGSLVLDPMAGSGTVVRVASEAGLRALGFDLDPLAVLMARVWTTPLDPEQLCRAATEVVAAARSGDPPSLPWIDADPETRAFVDYWFAPPQQGDLRRLSAQLCARWDAREGGRAPHRAGNRADPIGDALRLALSRLVVTKDRGATLARDVSHSRPHRVRATNDFPVFDEFLRATARLAQRLAEQPPRGGVTVAEGDARRLDTLPAASIDAVITSPPYLNAIDYLRGHRLALVWLGYQVAELRARRADLIGAERGPVTPLDREVASVLTASLDGAPDGADLRLAGLPPAERRMVERYAFDLDRVVSELARVLRPGGPAIFVVGRSCLRGVVVDTARLLVAVATRRGFALVQTVERELPPTRRALPPPAGEGASSRERSRTPAAPSDLEKRMRTETILTFSR